MTKLVLIDLRCPHCNAKVQIIIDMNDGMSGTGNCPKCAASVELIHSMEWGDPIVVPEEEE